MNHIRSIKKLLNMSNGNSQSSLADSELFGSQFWHENSQGNSEDMNLSFKSSQQSSQEAKTWAEGFRAGASIQYAKESVPRFITNYHTKPLLLGDVNDEKSIYGILDKFEEDRKKVEEKKNSDFLAKELQHVRETLVKMADTEHFFSSTLQNSLKSLQDDISQKFDTLVDKVNSHEEMMAALQERVQVMNNNGGTTADLDSHFKSLESGLEHLKEDQGRQNHGLEEALKHLSASLSEHSKRRSAEGLMDSAIQTSPGLSNFLQVRQLEVAPRTHPSYNLQQHQVGALPKNPAHVFMKGKRSLKSYMRRKKRTLVPLQKSKSTVIDENSQAATHRNKPYKPSTPLRERCDQNIEARQHKHSPGSQMLPNTGSRSTKALACFTPLNYCSQESSSPEYLTLVEPILDKLKDEPTTAENPDILWQLFDSD